VGIDRSGAVVFYLPHHFVFNDCHSRESGNPVLPHPFRVNPLSWQGFQQESGREKKERLVPNFNPN